MKNIKCSFTNINLYSIRDMTLYDNQLDNLERKVFLFFLLVKLFVIFLIPLRTSFLLLYSNRNYCDNSKSNLIICFLPNALPL